MSTRNTEENLQPLVIGKDFLMQYKGTSNKRKVLTNWISPKFKSLIFKKHLQRRNINLHTRKKISMTHISDKGLVSRINTTLTTQ